MGIKIGSVFNSNTRNMMHFDVYTGKDVDPHSAEDGLTAEL
jgi:hypothetical protein